MNDDISKIEQLVSDWFQVNGRSLVLQVYELGRQSVLEDLKIQQEVLRQVIEKQASK